MTIKAESWIFLFFWKICPPSKLIEKIWYPFEPHQKMTVFLRYRSFWVLLICCKTQTEKVSFNMATVENRNSSRNKINCAYWLFRFCSCFWQDESFLSFCQIKVQEALFKVQVANKGKTRFNWIMENDYRTFWLKSCKTITFGL